jgi:predicted ATP-dependent endonuclease of OLD family
MEVLNNGDPVARDMSDPNVGELRTVMQLLREHGEATPEVLEALDTMVSWYAHDDPERQVFRVLSARSPLYVFFSEEHRELRSTYELNDEIVGSPPAALSNMAYLAELDLSALWSDRIGGLNGAVQTHLLRANTKLKNIFEASWDQSDISLHLNLDGNTLHVMVLEGDDEITVFDERSAGLRMFAALRAFLATRQITKPVTLLIDEAETHLHVDAQANLVDTFIAQDAASKIIYTTHSPACLPPDLGVGVRAVIPKPDEQGVSEIKNGFWTGGTGFSPLMLAMGAGAAAFTPARYAVLAEGASEMLLLPSLIRNAIAADKLEYQIAPGLSEAPLEMYPDLDLEAARVAFLVDGDQGGADLRSGLIKHGVAEERILILGATTLENLLDPAQYRQCVTELLRDCNVGSPVPTLPELPGKDGESRTKLLRRWAESEGLKMPSKVAVASALVERGLTATTSESAAVLVQLDREIRRVLGFEPCTW